MDATIKSGFEKGFNIFVPEYTNSTYDNPYFDKETTYKYFNEFMWGTRYAKVITVEQTIQVCRCENFRVFLLRCGKRVSLYIFLEDCNYTEDRNANK